MPEYDDFTHGPTVQSRAKDPGPMPGDRKAAEQARDLAPDHATTLDYQHPQLTKDERARLIRLTTGELQNVEMKFFRALTQIEMDNLLKASKTKSLASMIVDLFFLVPLGTGVRAAWTSLNATFSAPRLTAAGAALSGRLLQGARGMIKIDPQRRYESLRDVTDMFTDQYSIYSEPLRESLDALPDEQLVAAYLKYKAKNIQIATLRARILEEISLYRDVVETIGKADSDFETIQVHVHTATKPRGRGPWPLWMAQREGGQWRLVRSVPTRWRMQSLQAHKARSGGAEPELTVATERHGHSLHPGIVAKKVADAFPAAKPRRRFGPPAPTTLRP